MAIRSAIFEGSPVRSPVLFWAALLLAAAPAISGGCQSREYTGERRYAVSGKVTVDGQPMQHGLISLLPQGEGGRVAGGPIKDGVYAIPEPQGPTAGSYRVQINWNKPTGKKVKDAWGEEIMDETREGLPAKYHTASELTADVSTTHTTFDFALQTK